MCCWNCALYKSKVHISETYFFTTFPPSLHPFVFVTNCTYTITLIGYVKNITLRQKRLFKISHCEHSIYLFLLHLWYTSCFFYYKSMMWGVMKENRGIRLTTTNRTYPCSSVTQLFRNGDDFHLTTSVKNITLRQKRLFKISHCEHSIYIKQNSSSPCIYSVYIYIYIYIYV
jgi:hypothetical protein